MLCSILGDDFKPALPSVVQTVQNIICPSNEHESVPSGNGYGMAPIGAEATIVTASTMALNITCEIEFLSGIQNGGELYQEEIRKRIQGYLDEVTKTWGTPLKGHTIKYEMTVYVSRIIYSILTISEVVNVTNVLINGSGSDLHLIETAEVQQIPVLETVVIQGG